MSFLQEAFDIFGDVGDLLEIYDQRKREEADGAEEEQEPDFSDEEAAETFRVEQVRVCKQEQPCCSAFLSVVCILPVVLTQQLYCHQQSTCCLSVSIQKVEP